jgi:nucleoside-diphosphate-sugar epimerase
MKSILVTGATGFIGAAVVKALADEGNMEILATGRTGTDPFEGLSGVRYFSSDLSIPGPPIDCEICVHCAGLASDNAGPLDFQKHNETATINLLNRLPDCKKFIYVSSASVYDFSDGKPKSEDDVKFSSGLSLYGISKLSTEQLICQAPIDQKFILRPRAVYGRGDRQLLPRLRKMVKGPFILYPGKREVLGSLTHINNLVQAIQLCIDSALTGTQIFNISDRTPYSVFKVCMALLSEGGTKIPISIIPDILRPILQLKERLGLRSGVTVQSLNYLSFDSVLAIRKAEELLNYKSEFSLDDFLKEKIESKD